MDKKTKVPSLAEAIQWESMEVSYTKIFLCMKERKPPRSDETGYVQAQLVRAHSGLTALECA